MASVQVSAAATSAGAEGTTQQNISFVVVIILWMDVALRWA